MPPRQARQQAAKASAEFGSLPLEGGTKASDTCANLSPPSRQASIPSTKALRSSSARSDGQPLTTTPGQGFTFSVLPIARPSRNSRRRNSWRTREGSGLRSPNRRRAAAIPARQRQEARPAPEATCRPRHSHDGRSGIADRPRRTPCGRVRPAARHRLRSASSTQAPATPWPTNTNRCAPVKRIILGAAAMKHRMRDDRIGELDRHARKRLAEHAANEPDVAGNDRIVEFAQPAKARDRNADLREPDPSPPCPVLKQLQRVAEHPADGSRRLAFSAAADARCNAVRPKARRRRRSAADRSAQEPPTPRICRATPNRSGHRSKALAASLPRSGPPPSDQTGCATGSPRTGAPPWPGEAETCRPTEADAPEWPHASAADFSAAPTFPSLSSFLLSVRMCARSLSTVKAVAGSIHGLAVVRGSKFKRAHFSVRSCHRPLRDAASSDRSIRPSHRPRHSAAPCRRRLRRRRGTR